MCALTLDELSIRALRVVVYGEVGLGLYVPWDCMLVMLFH